MNYYANGGQFISVDKKPTDLAQMQAQFKILQNYNTTTHRNTEIPMSSQSSILNTV
jgi:hypothetical protein